jgi:hypothetical protein
MNIVKFVIKMYVLYFLFYDKIRLMLGVVLIRLGIMTLHLWVFSMLLISTFNKYNIDKFYLFLYVDIYNVMFLFYLFYFGYSNILL